MPPVVRVLSFNVLHRIHALNWKEPVIDGFPDEGVRIRGITAFVLRWLDATPPGMLAAGCLQEASGDQLASLRAAVAGTRIQVFEHRYARLPRLRGEGKASGLSDPAEHLVTLIVGDAPAKLQGRTFEDDPGKGLLAVSIDQMTMVNTHVTFGDKRMGQLARVAEAARSGRRGAVCAGDFNAPVDVVAAALGDDFTLSNLSGQGPTRVPAGGHGGKTIDHIGALGGQITEAQVLPGVGLSDHFPVAATIRFPG